MANVELIKVKLMINLLLQVVVYYEAATDVSKPLRLRD